MAQYQGDVKWFNNAKGFGFLGRTDGPDVFCHYSAIQLEGYKTLKEGERVEFDVVQGNNREASGRQGTSYSSHAVIQRFVFANCSITDPSLLPTPRGFKHRANLSGSIDSICLSCYLTASSRAVEADLLEDEAKHRCNSPAWSAPANRS